MSDTTTPPPAADAVTDPAPSAPTPSATGATGASTPTEARRRPAEPAVPVVLPHRSPYAGIVTRGAAGVIDAVVISVVYLLTVLGTQAVIALLMGEPVTEVDMKPIAVALLLPVILWVYFAGGWWLFGKTVGSLVLGTRVVRQDGHRVGFVRAWVRFLATTISTAVFCLGWFWIAINRRSRAWHDIIAGTVVVYDWEEAHPMARDVALPD